MTDAAKRRVVIADDHPMFRAGLEAALSASADVVAVVDDGEAAVDAALRLVPDVVLMDLHMPGLGGIEASRRITTSNPSIAVLVLTMFDDDDAVLAAMRAGARGYLLKGSDGHDIQRAIDTVTSGGAIFGPDIATRIANLLDQTAANTHAAAFPQLRPREREILDLIARGHTNDQIAQRLSLSPKTVRNNVSNILTTLQVIDRNQAAIRARQAGLGTDLGDG